MCQFVRQAAVPRRLIQPVLPFGRPGSLTRSQRSPSRLVLCPSTGSTVRPSVIGRRACTSPITAEAFAGFDRTLCELSRAANSWVGFTTGGPRALAGAPPVHVAASSTIPARNVSRIGTRHERTEPPSTRDRAVQPAMVNRSDRRCSRAASASASAGWAEPASASSASASGRSEPRSSAASRSAPATSRYPGSLTKAAASQAAEVCQAAGAWEAAAVPAAAA